MASLITYNVYRTSYLKAVNFRGSGNNLLRHFNNFVTPLTNVKRTTLYIQQTTNFHKDFTQVSKF